MQSKVEDGLSKLQGGLQQGKERFRQSQEYKKLSQDVQAATVKKGELLFQIGEKVYGQIRAGETFNNDYESFVEQLIQQDKQIHQLNEEIEKINQANDQQTCECGGVVQDDDKFCGSCGKEVIHKKVLSEEEMVTCPSCETTIPYDAQFCKCCGVKNTNVASVQ